MNGQKSEEFTKYRDIAPAAVTDDIIKSLIAKNVGNSDAIVSAIENMWHDLPKKTETDEWNVSSKSKAKKDVIGAQQSNFNQGRGGPRGRSIPPSSGRGQGGDGGRGGGGRGDRMVGRGPAPGRGSSISRPSPQSVQFQQSQQSTIETAASVASSGSSGWGSGGTTLAEKLKQAEMQKLLPPPVPAANLAPIQEEVVVEEFPVMAPSSSAPIIPPVVAVVSEDELDEMIEVAVISDDGLDKDEVEAVVDDVKELVESVIELSVQETIEETNIEIPMTLPTPQPAPVGMSHATPMSPVREIIPVVQVAQELQDSAPKAFLKMGKWEAPSETSAFQFGSFGSYGNVSNEDTSSMSESWGGASVTESADIQKKAQAEVSSAVWGASGSNSNGSDLSTANSSSGPSPMSSLFPVPKGLPSVSDGGISSSSNSQYNQQKPSAPPGLEQPHHSSMAKALPRQDSRSAVPVQNRKPESAQKKSEELQYQPPQQYQQPAGIPIPAGRGMPPVTMPIMPYGYPTGFDLQSQQYLQQQQQSPYGQPAPVIPPSTAASSPAPAPGTPTAQQGQQQGQGAAPGAPQGQQQYGPPPGMANPYGFNPYGNPYYPNPQAYFYGQPQVQNAYYNQQARGDYNQASRGPYGSELYGAPGGQYPNVYQGGAFPDASGYPGMPMQHPSMIQQGGQGQGQQGAAASPGGASAQQGQGKQQKGGLGASSTAPQQQQQQQQDPQHGYGYNPYNPRDAQQSWQYQQNPAQGWGVPQMFPGGQGQPPSGGPQQGFQPPQQQQGPQQGQGRGASSSYGGGAAQQGQQSQQSFSRGPAQNPAGPSSGSSHQNW